MTIDDYQEILHIMRLFEESPLMNSMCSYDAYLFYRTKNKVSKEIIRKKVAGNMISTQLGKMEKNSIYGKLASSREFENGEQLV